MHCILGDRGLSIFLLVIYSYYLSILLLSSLLRILFFLKTKFLSLQRIWLHAVYSLQCFAIRESLFKEIVKVVFS